MSFKILYVENYGRDFTEIEEAINKHNKKSVTEKVQVYRATNPEEMKGLLGPQFDLILADVYFDDPVEGPDSISRLVDIITFAKTWADTFNNGQALPIIAYSGKASLKECLEYKEHLYDIWDKNTTSDEYVTWRLSKLAIELSRIQPDSCLQGLIRHMNSRVPWHNDVKEMTIDYDAAWTEYDQIDRVKQPIIRIAQTLGTFETCERMWKVMEKSDSMARALSRKARGHARHAINVFWIGYYILNHELLSGYFRNAFSKIVADRQNMSEVRKEEPIHAVNTIWFYTGLFHDIGISVEKSNLHYEHHETLQQMFGDLAPPLPASDDYSKKRLPKEIVNLLSEMNGMIGKQLTAFFRKGIQEKKPDHGLVAADYLLRNITIQKQVCYAREAARAIILHNAIGDIEKSTDHLVSWEKDPIACLLLLSDQLQTWDRERGDQKLSDDDRPDRAELLHFSVTENDTRPSIEMHIDYVVQPHVLHYPDIYKRVKNALESTIFDKPTRALNRIAKPWPFRLNLLFSMGRDVFLELPYD